MTQTPTALAALALLASALALSPSASAAIDAQCLHAQVEGPNHLTREADAGTVDEGLVPGFWERASIQYTAYMPCYKLVSLFDCFLNPSACTEWEQQMVEDGLTYVADRLGNVVVSDDDCPRLMTDYEVLVAYGPEAPADVPVCADPDDVFEPRPLPPLPSPL